MFGIDSAVISAVNEELVDAYKKFMAYEPDSLVNNYGLKENEVIARVFEFKPSVNGDILLDEKGAKAGDELYRTIPIVKILASSDPMYPVGTFAKLNDYSASTITNPYYDEYLEAIKEAPMQGSAKAPEPAKVVNRFNQTFSKFMFVVNPLKLFNSEDDFMVLKIPTGYLDCSIKDPSVYVS